MRQICHTFKSVISLGSETEKYKSEFRIFAHEKREERKFFQLRKYL